MPKKPAKKKISDIAFGSVKFQEKLLFTKHLSIMVKSGITISESISTLTDSSKSPIFKKTLTTVLADLQNGQTLAKSLGKHPKVFDQFYVSLVSIGEESGTIEENLEFLAKQLAKDYSLTKKVRGALIYPAIVISITMIMGGFISFFILPKLIDFFDAFEVELPATTRALLFIANTSRDYGIYILGGLVALIVGFRLLLTIPKFRFYWHSFVIKIPVFGKLISFGQISRFTRNLGTLLKSGVPVSTSMEVTANTLSNLKFQKDLREVTESLTKGKNISDTLKNKKYSEYPLIVSRMIDVGEETGKLDETLLYLGDFYEDEVDDISKNLSTLLEPILLVFIGLAVGFVALAIISPIYELTGSIRR